MAIKMDVILSAQKGSDELDQMIWSGLPSEAPQLRYTQDFEAACLLAGRIGPKGAALVMFDSGKVGYRFSDELTLISGSEGLPEGLRCKATALEVVKYALRIVSALEPLKNI